MQELEINHQALYFHPQNAAGVALNLINFGMRQFITTIKYQKREILKNL